MAARTTLVIALAAASIALLSGSRGARADAIDGHWCHKDGRRMSIEGSRFVTPGGTSMEGDYERHGFAYVVPEGEANAGRRVSMALQNEDIIRLFIPGQGPGPSPPAIETWQRCDLTM